MRKRSAVPDDVVGRSFYNLEGEAVIMLNRLEEQSSLSRLRGVLNEVESDGQSTSPDWESDLREVRRRLARLRSEFPGLAKDVELNIRLVKAGERLNGARSDGSA